MWIEGGGEGAGWFPCAYGLEEGLEGKGGKGEILVQMRITMIRMNKDR